MFSRIVILIVGVLVAINAAQEETKREEVEGYWYPCGGIFLNLKHINYTVYMCAKFTEELKTPLMSEDIKVFIPDCPPINGSETRCQMKKGTESILKIQFSKQFVCNCFHKFTEYVMQSQQRRFHHWNESWWRECPWQASLPRCHTDQQSVHVSTLPWWPTMALFVSTMESKQTRLTSTPPFLKFSKAFRR